MRRRPPQLIDPKLAHQNFLLARFGVAAPRSTADRVQQVQRFGNPQRQNDLRPVLTGNWGDGSAQERLAAILQEQGIVRNEAILSDLVDPSIGQITVFRHADQSAADFATNDLTGTWRTAISLSVILDSGKWGVRMIGGLNLAHSASGTVDRRAKFGTNNGSTSTATMSTTREHYPIGQAFTNIVSSVGTIWTAQIEYKPNAAGTASARAPWLIVFAWRMA